MPGRTDDRPQGESARKRARRADTLDNLDAGDGADAVSAGSDFRHSRQSNGGLPSLPQRKKVRLSDPELTNGTGGSSRQPATRRSYGDDNDGGGDEDEEDLDGERANGQETHTQNGVHDEDEPPRTQYELLRDNNFDHLRHEVEDDLRARERIKRREPNKLGENAVADNGIIERIVCVNFMCHARLRVDLGPLLNFVVGENGSGKSAILTALTLCLGGKASSTNRGGSLKSFIKEGCDRAVLSVTIKNCGTDAYKPDIFGESIIVERHFSKSGTSGFKIKSATEQIISTKKQEVDDIVEYYALQVDNPLNILSQDNARQFLNASTKAQKYKFFIEGVQLQQLDNDYRLISESLEQMVAKVPDQEERVKEAKAALDKANRLKEAIEGNKQIRIKYRVLRNQMVWAQVVEQERELKEREKKVADAEEALLQALAAVEKAKAETEETDTKMDQLKMELEQVQAGLEDARRQLKEAKEAFQKAKAELQQIHHEEREAHSQVLSATKKADAIKKKISEETKRLSEGNGEQHAIALRELDEAKAAVEAIQRDIESEKERQPELRRKFEASQAVMPKIKEDVGRRRGEVDAVAQKLRALQDRSKGQFAGYDPKIPDLLESLDGDRRFAQKPIGPLGTHIRLLQPKWSTILESYLGPTLNGFVVSSKRDETLLREVMDRHGIRNVPIFIAARGSINTEGREPDPEFDTILRVLDIDNQMVRNQLIIMHSAEQVILIPERPRAQEIMFDGRPPRNVKVCLSFHDTKPGHGLRLTCNHGNSSTTPVRPNLRLSHPRMRTDQESQVALVEADLANLRTGLQSLQAEQRRLEQECQRCHAAMEQSSRKLKALGNDLRRAQVVVGEKEANLDQFDGSDSRLQALQANFAEAEQEKEYHGGQLGSLVLNKRKKNDDSEQAHVIYKDQQARFEKLEKRVAAVEEKIRRLDSYGVVALTQRNDAEAAVSLAEEEKARCEAKVQRQKSRVEMTIQQAMPLCKDRVHIPDNETYDSIEKQYKTLGDQLKKEESKNGLSDKQVHDLLAQATRDYQKAQANLTSMKKINLQLRDSLNLRLEKWRKFQRYISSQSRANFIYLLSERGFRGKLLLDHERKMLDLQVEPDSTEKKAAGRSTKTLSGGEKSFSSICLLLAIWEAMGSPLRCLDEFDVFMDNVNRAISTSMLITAARRSVNRQYIFITPNAIEGKGTLGQDVKIIRLYDPRQTRITDHT